MNDHPDNSWALCEADAQALDALVEAAFDPAQVDLAHRTRAERLAMVLGLLDTHQGLTGDDERTLADATIARILRHDSAHAPTVELIPADEEALDAWILARHDARHTPHALRERAMAHEALAALLATPSVLEPPRGQLIEQTLKVIDQAQAERDNLMSIETGRGRWRLPVRIADLVSVAAVLLFGAAVVIPVLSGIREQGRRAACSTNLGQTALAFASYASSNRDALPVVSAGFGGGTSGGGGSWMQVGDPDHSNSANLYALARLGYATLANLACPGNAHAPHTQWATDAADWQRLEEVSYSYQNMFGPRQPNWRAPTRIVILADRSPVILRVIRRQPVYPYENSPNHAGRGQAVLVNDGSSQWLTTPVMGQNDDNIWLPRHIEVKLDQLRRFGRIDPLRGDEMPDDSDDVFLVP